MIKRLKWNTLYGSGGGEESDGDISSSDEDLDTHHLTKEQIQLQNQMLLKLTEQDPDIAEVIRQKNRALESSSEEEEEGEGDVELESPVKQLQSAQNDTEKVEANEFEDMPDDPNEKYAAWRECNICPGRRFLNDGEVDAHLASKRHRRAVARFEKTQKAEADAATESANPASSENASKAIDQNKNSRNPPNAVDEEKAQLRKENVKRKLKALKKRKWEKRQAEKENSVDPDCDAVPKSVDSSDAKGSYEANMGKIKSKKDEVLNARKSPKASNLSNAKTKSHVKTALQRTAEEGTDKKKARKRIVKSKSKTTSESIENGEEQRLKDPNEQSAKKRIRDLESTRTPKRSKKEKFSRKESVMVEENGSKDVEELLQNTNGSEACKPKLKKRKKDKKKKVHKQLTSPAKVT